MEIDHVPYIFGSFSRRRQSHHLSATKSANNRTLLSKTDKLTPCHTHSRSQPSETTTAITNFKQATNFWRPQSCFVSPKILSANSETSNTIQTNLDCVLCGRVYLEPRVLNCLHTFCTRCLQQLLNTTIDAAEIWSPSDQEGLLLSMKSASPESQDSGCESSTLTSNTSRKTVELQCPICKRGTALGRHSILGLPHHYIAQHRIFLSTLNDETTRLLCDLCTNDVTATHRCSECLVNVCDLCTDIHRRHKIASQHELLKLSEVRQRGLMKIHRQIMCQNHPEQELIAYCNNCAQVICNDCILSHHVDHHYDTSQRACVQRTPRMRSALKRTHTNLQKDTILSERLKLTQISLESKCNKLQEEVENFIQSYRDAIELHRKQLLEEINCLRNEKLAIINQQRIEIEKRITDAQDTMLFTQDLLKEGSHIEILTFVDSILQKFDSYQQFNNIEVVPKVIDNIQFLPKEMKKESYNSVPLFGVISSQTVAPNQCVLHIEGVETVQTHKKVDLILETRDGFGEKMQYGNETIDTQIWCKSDPLSKTKTEFVSVSPLEVHDKHDGNYVISFIPKIAGQITLSVTIHGRHVQNSPFSIRISDTKTIKSSKHNGTFHCCSWCSLGGQKVTGLDKGYVKGYCACGGQMPGGYLGCGHGHHGHPGKPHWSCCGSTVENSLLCEKNLKNINKFDTTTDKSKKIYEITL